MRQDLLCCIKVTVLLTATCNFTGALGLYLAGTLVNPLQYKSGAAIGDWGFRVSGQNSSMPPGDNFYNYVSGTYIDELKIPADRTRWGQFDILNDLTQKQLHDLLEHEKHYDTKVGKFFASYMDEDRLETLDIDPLQPTLNFIASMNGSSDFATMAAREPVGFFYSPFSFGIGADDRNPDRYCVMIDQGGLGLPQEYYSDHQFAQKKAAYRNHIAVMLKLARWPDPEDASRKILAFEDSIAAVSWTPAQMRDPVALYNPTTLQELQKVASGFDWMTFFRVAGLEHLPANVSLIVQAKSAVISIAKIIGATSTTDLQAWAAFHTVSRASNSLSSRFENATFEFFGRTMEGQEKLSDRWKRGVSKLSSYMGEAMGKSYASRYFSEKSKRTMEDLTMQLKHAFKLRLESNAWLAPRTKAKALVKLRKMDIQVGYPKKFEKYDGLVVDEKNLFGNVERARAFSWNSELSRLGKAVDKDEWAMMPYEINAYNMPNFNQIVFPAGILQPPFFDSAADMAVNFGAIGVVIGHEMTHGFDDEGCLYDEHGRLNSWWSDTDTKKFQELSNAYGDQFGKFRQGIPAGSQINSNLTRGESIADLGGLNIALTAYHNWIQAADSTQKQKNDTRYFLGFGQVWASKDREDALKNQLISDPHPPAIARVNVPTGNMQEWYAAFDVKNTSHHFRDAHARVVIW